MNIINLSTHYFLLQPPINSELTAPVTSGFDSSERQVSNVEITSSNPTQSLEKQPLSSQLHKSSFQLSVVKPKIYADNPMNQSEYEVNTCSRRQARENACEQQLVLVSFLIDRLMKWREIFLANHKA